MRFWVFICFALLVSPAWAKLYQWVDDGGRTHYSDKPPPGQAVEGADGASVPSQAPTPEASVPGNRGAAASAPDVEGISYSRPGYSEALYLRHLLETQNHAQLNRELQKGLDLIERDSTADLPLLRAYNSFGVPSDEMLERLNKWVEQYPDSYQPYLARATNRLSRGWRERGGAAAYKTPRDNFSRMAREFEFAHEDARKALQLNKSAIVGYHLLVSLQAGGGAEKVAYRALQDANRIYPHNYIVRRGYILNLSPRWGGSWQEIRDFVSNQPLDSNVNPKLGELAGYELYERGRLFYIKKEYQLALDRFDQSLQFGPNPVTLYFRGRSNYWLDKYSQAIDDFTKAIYLQPDVADYYYWRSKAFFYFGRYTDSLADIERAYALEPMDENIQKFRQRLLRKYGHPQLKGIDKDKAREIVALDVPKYDEKAQYLKGASHLALGENERAEEVFRHLVVLKSENFEYARWLDFALFRQAKLEEILKFWDDYIEKNPTSGSAYLERAGTYYHLEQYYKALESARIADKLGNEGAEEFVGRLQKLITRPSMR